MMLSSPLAEADCLRRIAQQDRDALAALYRAYHPRLVRFLARFTRQDTLVEEVINDTFWVVWQRAAAWRGEAKVSTWILGIAWRQALKALRDGADPCQAGDDEGLETAFSVDPGPAREQRDWLDKALARLPAQQRALVELVYGQGFALDEAAAVLQCPVGTAKSRLFHARLRLRHLMPELAGELRPVKGVRHER